jgi:hypothetical protein
MWIIGLIVMALAGRMVPHPDNFTPVLAVALFGGATLSGGIGYFIPFAAMFISDLLLGNSFDWMSLVVYGCFLVGAGLGQWLGRERTWTKTGFATISGSLLFYAVTNFAVWITPNGLYAHTLDGLIECYWMALPFFRNSLAGDLFWIAVLFGVFDLARSWSKWQRAAPGKLA